MKNEFTQLNLFEDIIDGCKSGDFVKTSISIFKDVVLQNKL